MLITDNLLLDLTIAVGILLLSAFFYIKHKYSYWTRRGVTQLSPVFPFGNYGVALPTGFSLGARTNRFYNAFKKSGNKLGGVYIGLDPYIVVVDPLYAKGILTKDFQSFVDRAIYFNKKNLITLNIFSQKGDDWRNARAKLTNMFTSSKMKFYFNTVKQCSGDLKTNLLTLEKSNADVDIYEVMGCYFTDIIGSVTFGIEANSFKSKDAIFRKVARDLFQSLPITFRMILFIIVCYPKLATVLDVPLIQPHIEKFFFDVVPETMEYRMKNNIYREDFLQLMIELKTSGEFTTEEIVAQCFNFFVAGFETSSTTSTFLLYELGVNRDIQDRVRGEINSVLKKHDGDFTYEAIQEMTYLSQVLAETMRKYPPLTALTRVCVKDYKFPDSEVFIEKGTTAILPVLGYHYDPEVFPDPEKFDPDRFEDKNVKYDGYLPFGYGPRNCIGERLGVMQVKLGVSEVLRNYEISVSPKMDQRLEFDEYIFVTKMKQRILLKLKKITN